MARDQAKVSPKGKGLNSKLSEKDAVPSAKISVSEAIEKTNRSVKGDVTAARLDHRGGVLVYVIEVDDNKPAEYLKEVIIDANTGELLSLVPIK